MRWVQGNLKLNKAKINSSHLDEPIKFISCSKSNSFRISAWSFFQSHVHLQPLDQNYYLPKGRKRKSYISNFAKFQSADSSMKLFYDTQLLGSWKEASSIHSRANLGLNIVLCFTKIILGMVHNVLFCHRSCLKRNLSLSLSLLIKRSII